MCELQGRHVRGQQTSTRGRAICHTPPEKQSVPSLRSASPGGRESKSKSAGSVPGVEEHGGAADDGAEEVALGFGETRHDKRRHLVDDGRCRQQDTRVAGHLERGEEILTRRQLQEAHALCGSSPAPPVGCFMFQRLSWSPYVLLDSRREAVKGVLPMAF